MITVNISDYTSIYRTQYRLSQKYIWARMKPHHTVSARHGVDSASYLQTCSCTVQPDPMVVGPSKWTSFSACSVWTAFAVSVAVVVYWHISVCNFPISFCSVLHTNNLGPIMHGALLNENRTILRHIGAVRYGVASFVIQCIPIFIEVMCATLMTKEREKKVFPLGSELL